MLTRACFSRLPAAKHVSLFTRTAYSVQKVLDYDLLVIGGGSGGLSCAKTASDLGAKVALADAVTPTPIGTRWGIGGTCANVGCVPKKLMHEAALLRRAMGHAHRYGFEEVSKQGGQVPHNWHDLVAVVDERIKAGNWVYRVQLNDKKIKYYNAFASFVNHSTIQLTGTDKKKTQALVCAKNVVISTGLRPKYPNVPGAEHGITSDDLFQYKNDPGRTLVVGGGYVALETAGLLADLGHPVDLMIRSIPLRGFDRDCTQHVMAGLVAHGVKILHHHIPTSVTLGADGKTKKVSSKLLNMSAELKNTAPETIGEYDTVIWAIGREPRLDSLAPKKAGIALSSSTGKILADEQDATTAKHVYAIGDVVENRPELTPSAIRAGFLLAQRIFAGSKHLMSYDKIATTVFTPLELSCMGLSEDKAIEIYGPDDIEVYHAYFTPYHMIIPEDKDKENCYLKVITKRDAGGTVLGMHFVGPHAAEVMQGYAVAFKRGFTYEQLADTVAIHPCAAEEFVKVTVTKRSGKDPHVPGCCG